MQDTSESSIWRNLAVAFGDGLAFGVGMKLSQHTAARTPSPQAQSDIRQLATRIGQIEEHIKRIGAAPAGASLDHKVLEAIVNAVEARLQEYSTQAERRLADMEARIAVELKSLDQQDQSVAKRLSQDLSALHGQLSALSRGLSESIARVVAEQVVARTAALNGLDERIARQVAAHSVPPEAIDERIAEHVAVRTASLNGLEERIQEQVNSRTVPVETIEERIREQVAARTAVLNGLEARIEQQVNSRTVPIGTIEERIAEQVNSRVSAEQAGFEERIGTGIRAVIASAVNERMGPAERSLRDLLAGIAQLCTDAATRIEPPAGGDPEPAPSAPAEDNDVPGFAQPQKPNKLWRVPLVSSMVIAIGSVILMQLR